MASTIRNLTERRVPQVLAVYLGAAFGVVQFVDFVGSRYLLPGIWTDLTLLGMAVLLPSVLLYTYNHGRPGPDEWRRSEKIFIPANLLILILLVTFVGAGESLGPTSQRIMVQDEKGNTREAVVPNKAFRKRVAFFMFDSPSQDAKWLQFGLPQMAWQDLLQQNFIEVLPPVRLREGLRRKGFASGVDVPLSLKREVAQELHVPHFVTGRIEKSGDEYVATVQAYETESMKLIKERTYRAADPTQLADQVSAGLIDDLDIPKLTDAQPDMPVSELLTKNPKALRAYVDASAALQVDNDFARAASTIKEAVALDPTFASAYLIQYAVASLSNNPAVASGSLQKAMDHSYRMPERLRELLKSDYYIQKQDFPRAFAVLDMLARLYPDDITIQENLMTVNTVRDNKDAIIEAGRNILALDPTRSELLLQLGETYERKGDNKSALKQYAAYSAKHPQDARAHRKAGALHRRAGAHKEARAEFEKALLIEPGDIETLVQFAVLDRNIGDFGAADQKFTQAMDAAKTPQERSQVLTGLANLHEFRGDIRGSIKHREAALGEMGKFQPPVIVLVSGMTLPGDWARVDAAAAERELAKLRKLLTAPWNVYIPIAELTAYIETEDVARAEQAATAVDALIKGQGMKAFQALAVYGRGRIAELRGNNTDALKYYREAVKLDPMDTDMPTHIGRALRKLGKRAEAQAELNKSYAAAPADGRANLELGLLYQESGDMNKARAHLQRALQTWQNADPNFKPARSAREALTALK